MLQINETVSEPSLCFFFYLRGYKSDYRMSHMLSYHQRKVKKLAYLMTKLNAPAQNVSSKISLLFLFQESF